jgi:hypothetical protein
VREVGKMLKRIIPMAEDEHNIYLGMSDVDAKERGLQTFTCTITPVDPKVEIHEDGVSVLKFPLNNEGKASLMAYKPSKRNARIDVFLYMEYVFGDDDSLKGLMHGVMKHLSGYTNNITLCLPDKVDPLSLGVHRVEE